MLLNCGILVYLDDILLYSGDVALYDELLHKVVALLEKHKLHVKEFQCCFFFLKSVEFFGYIINEESEHIEKGMIGYAYVAITNNSE